MSQSLLTYKQALTNLADSLLTRDEKSIKIGGFYEFVRDIWSKSYEHPERFKMFHIEVICHDVEEALATGKNYVCVLPRGFLKSTVPGYAFCIWRLLKMGNSDSTILYTSFSDGMSQYHISEMKKHIRRNPILSEWMIDRSPNADFSFRYSVNGFQKNILHGGVLSFKRGTHVDGAVVADDLLQDPDNPARPTEILKVEEFFFSETMYIPNPGVPVFVLGTPLLPDDLLSKLKKDDRFLYRFMPALDPIPGRRVLAPEIRDEAQLLREKAARPHAFAAEMMLSPMSSVKGYFTDTDISRCENKDLASFDPYKEWDFNSEFTVAGFDVGKKRHPSHLAVYASKGGVLKQVHQVFLDGWDYNIQKEYLNTVAKNFALDVGYYDSTRGELDDRGLDSRWKSLNFTLKDKRKMAQVFEEFVQSGNLSLIVDERQKSQILAVDNDLDAAESPLGHGDSFWSNALALLAYKDKTTVGTQDVGNVQDIFGNDKTKENINFKEFVQPINLGTGCPNCKEFVGWIEERKLCLICQHRCNDNCIHTGEKNGG
ncbi:hypothetical protein HYS94_01825 [Candidatus Daviesbacteria bacterium]|nr:hypothetical protein [Candidatus Daviesbacteria bacterium]